MAIGDERLASLGGDVGAVVVEIGFERINETIAGGRGTQRVSRLAGKSRKVDCGSRLGSSLLSRLVDLRLSRLNGSAGASPSRSFSLWLRAITMDTVPLTVQRPPRSFRARLLRWGVMSIIFVGGGVAWFCVGTMQLIEHMTPAQQLAEKPDRFTEFLLAHLKKDLSLSDAQYPLVEKIVLKHHAAFDELRKKTQPLFEKEMAKMDRDMLAVLDETQGDLWKTRMKRMGGHWRGGRPGGGPPRSNRDGKPREPDRKPQNPKDPKAGHDEETPALKPSADAGLQAKQPESK